MTAWTLIPGSDTPGDRVEPWTRAATSPDESYAYFVCLVDIPAITLASDTWVLYSADTPWTFDALDNAPLVPLGPVAAGRYLAQWSVDFSPPPLPAGWLPVEGPKFLPAPDNSYYYFAGRVHSDGSALPVNGPAGEQWLLFDPALSPTFAVIDNESPLYISSGSSSPTAGEYVVGYNPHGGPAPAYPTGWTPLTSVCGPIAITDENAGAVIDDIAYVVSGFAYNVNTIAAVQLGYRDRGAWSDEESYSVDDVVLYQGNKAWHCIADATAGTEQPNANPTSWERLPVPSVWPYLERFDLTTQKWLPRIKLPLATWPVTPWFSLNNFWHTGQPATYEGVTYYALQTFSGAMVPGTVQAADYWTTTPPTTPPQPYAAEGGFAGAINGKLYFGGGDGDNITGSEFFSYDPATQAFERLGDCPAQPDYNPYGTVAGKLYIFFGTSAAVYDANAGSWSWPVLMEDSIGIGDQVQGVELGGKLYFVYDRVYVFDPVALTVEAKAAVPTGSSSCAWTDGSGLHLVDGGDPRAQFVYDVGADTWTAETVTGMPIAGYAVTLHGSGGTYVLSGLYDHFNGSNVRGVYALLAATSSYVAQAFTHLTHLGFSPRQAALLQADPGTASVKALIRSGFSPRQAKTLKRGDRSLKALIRGGFDRHQAKVLEA